jgi:hypothetical protein
MAGDSIWDLEGHQRPAVGVLTCPPFPRADRPNEMRAKGVGTPKELRA